MKCIRFGKSVNLVFRATEEEAAEAVQHGWHYSSKGAWKRAGRKYWKAPTEPADASEEPQVPPYRAPL